RGREHEGGANRPPMQTREDSSPRQAGVTEGVDQDHEHRSYHQGQQQQRPPGNPVVQPPHTTPAAYNNYNTMGAVEDSTTAFSFRDVHAELGMAQTHLYYCPRTSATYHEYATRDGLARARYYIYPPDLQVDPEKNREDHTNDRRRHLLHLQEEHEDHLRQDRHQEQQESRGHHQHHQVPEEDDQNRPRPQYTTVGKECMKLDALEPLPEGVHLDAAKKQFWRSREAALKDCREDVNTVVLTFLRGLDLLEYLMSEVDLHNHNILAEINFYRHQVN
ncbi:unnamed protein product, partial [Amoebophrya sp. A25]